MKNKRILLIIVIILIIAVAGYFIIKNYSKPDMVIIRSTEQITKLDENKIKELVSNDFFKGECNKCKNLNTELSLSMGSRTNKENVDAVVTCDCVSDETNNPVCVCSKRYDIGKVNGTWTIISSGDVGWE